MTKYFFSQRKIPRYVNLSKEDFVKTSRSGKCFSLVRHREARGLRKFVQQFQQIFVEGIFGIAFLRSKVY